MSHPFQLTKQEPILVQDVPKHIATSAKGRYKAQVLNSEGDIVKDTGDWKPNLILDVGLDKIAHMPWAQVFQWCAVGTDDTPTAEKYINTNLRVDVTSGSSPDTVVISADVATFSTVIRGLTAGDRGTGVFGLSTDVGTTIYLPEIDTQYKILTGVPTGSFYNLSAREAETYRKITQGPAVSLSAPSLLQDLSATIYRTEQTNLFDQYKLHSWYLTGRDDDLNTVYSGSDWLTENTILMTRTYDFYMELTPVTINEIALKESPAATTAFSRIVLDDPFDMCAGQYLRISYQLLVTFEPGVSAYREVQSEGDWVNGTNATGLPVLTGYECIQKHGVCVVDDEGIAVPYDIAGVANEPYAPGSHYLGPGYGYTNRWKNGDTSLSHATKVYDKAAENPWILGGDLTSPPNLGIKYEGSPTKNYLPRQFRSFLEWDGDASVTIPNGTGGTKSVAIPGGLEYTYERDAWRWWHTPVSPLAHPGVVLSKNEVFPNASATPREDWIHNFPYVTDVSPISGKAYMQPVITYDGPAGALWDPVAEGHSAVPQPTQGAGTVFSQLIPNNSAIIPFGPNGIASRDVNSSFCNLSINSQLQANPSWGGGFATLEYWRNWTYTPLGSGGIPDTAGNYLFSDTIPVQGSSAFISTSIAPLTTIGNAINRSHAVSGKDVRFDGSMPICFETPCYASIYIPGEHKRTKVAEWETSFANLTAIKCIGIGPTSTTLDQRYMTDAAKYNSYVFTFENPASPSIDDEQGGFVKLSTYKLRAVFQYTWYRDLS